MSATPRLLKSAPPFQLLSSHCYFIQFWDSTMCTAVKVASNKPTSSERAESIHLQAHVKWEAGDFRSAFRLMRAAAKLGAYGSKNNLGYMYDQGNKKKKKHQHTKNKKQQTNHTNNNNTTTNIG